MSKHRCAFELPDVSGRRASATSTRLWPVLDPDVVFNHDSGQRPRARELVVGPEAAARIALDRGQSFADLARPAVVNGAAGVIVESGQRVIGVRGITVAGDRIAEIDLITDAAKLRALADHDPAGPPRDRTLTSRAW